MKQLKLLGLALVAGIALTASLGAGTAAATELCKSASTPCPALEMIQPGHIYQSTSSSIQFKSSAGTVECSGSSLEGETTTTGGSGATAVAAKTTALSFTGCHLGMTTCTISSR